LLFTLSCLLAPTIFLFCLLCALRYLPSFPTRRSSDLKYFRRYFFQCAFLGDDPADLIRLPFMQQIDDAAADDDAVTCRTDFLRLFARTDAESCTYRCTAQFSDVLQMIIEGIVKAVAHTRRAVHRLHVAVTFCRHRHFPYTFLAAGQRDLADDCDVVFGKRRADLALLFVLVIRYHIAGIMLFMR